MIPRPIPIFALAILLSGGAGATGLLRDGAGARSEALGGAVVADPASPLDAMWTNPAGLAGLAGPALELNYFGAYADARFRNAVNGEVGLDDNDGHGLAIAWAQPIADGRGALGLSFAPEATLIGDWDYIDAPGGLDGTVSYGNRRHRSEFLALRGALGGAWRINERISVGGSVGLVYEEINLQVPYIFQRAPGLAGFKTLLDLQTDGLAWNGELGLTVRLCDGLDLGLRYRSSTSLESEGRASGDAYAQLAAAGLVLPRTSFGYDATVSLSLPEIYSGGLAWRPDPRWLFLLQVDWIPWGEHFDGMTVELRNGDNPGLGADDVIDRVPLSWQDRFSYRLGIEHRWDDCWTLRGGYVFSPAVISTAYVTPLNAAITEQSLSAGLGYRRGSWSWDLAYRYALPNEETIGRSGYRAGEYSDSSVELQTHWWSLSTTYHF